MQRLRFATPLKMRAFHRGDSHTIIERITLAETPWVADKLFMLFISLWIDAGDASQIEREIAYIAAKTLQTTT